MTDAAGIDIVTMRSGPTRTGRWLRAGDDIEIERRVEPLQDHVHAIEIGLRNRQVSNFSGGEVADGHGCRYLYVTQQENELSEVLSDELLRTTFKSLRQEIAEVRRLALGLAEAMRGVERRIIGVEQRFDALKDDLEIMFKTEIIGFRSSVQSTFDDRFDRLEMLLKGNAT